jgi:hypothetical protein
MAAVAEFLRFGRNQIVVQQLADIFPAKRDDRHDVRSRRVVDQLELIRLTER